jgi:hypothetical protein
MNQILQQAQRMQQEMLSAQQDLAESQVTGSAGGGLVRAVVTGAGELTSLEIDRTVVDPDDIETLTDLIIAAVRDAHSEIQRRANEQFGALNAGVEGLLGGAGPDSPLAGLFGDAGGTETIPGRIEAGDENGDDEPGRPVPGSSA